LLKDPDPQVRQAAAGALGKVRLWATRAFEPLLDAARDEDLQTRANVFSALAPLITDDERVLRLFRQALADAAVRGQALPHLIKLAPESPRVLDLFMDSLRSLDKDQRRAAIDALAELGRESRWAIGPLCDCLKDAEASLRRASAAALLRVCNGRAELEQDGPPEAEPVMWLQSMPEARTVVETLKSALHDQDKLVRRDVAATLGHLGAAARDAKAALVITLNDSDSEVRANAAEALGKLGPEARDCADALLAVLKDPDASVRAKAIAGLRGMQAEPKRIVEPLRAALNDTDEKVRTNAAAALGDVFINPGQLPDETYAELFVALALAVRQEEEQEVVEATDLLPGRMDDDVVKVVLPVLVERAKEAKGESRPKLVRALVHVLARTSYSRRAREEDDAPQNGPPDVRFRDAVRAAVPLLIEALESTDDVLRSRTAFALAMIGPEAKAAVPALLGALQSPDNPLSGAAFALGQIGPAAKEAVPALIDLLKSTDVVVRRNAASALGEMGPAAKAAVGPLQECLQDPNDSVRDHARMALRKIQPAAAIRQK
jgi:HEAT repeat protein